MVRLHKGLFLTAILLIACTVSWAQYVATPIAYNWVEINPNRPGGLNGTNAGITLDDQNVGPFNIGFTFTFYGTGFTSVRMCSNGWASFTATTTTFSNVTIPTASEPNNLLAVYWDDMNFNPTYTPPGYGSAWYFYDASNNRFIMEWDSIAHYSATGSLFTFQIILHTDGTIDYMYKNVTGGTVSPFPSATVGVENATGTVGTLCTFNGSGPMEPAANSGIHFAISSSSLDVTLAPVSPPIVIPANGGTFSFNATVVRTVGPQAAFQVWARDKYPDGTYTPPTLGPVSINPPVGATVTRLRQQNVPSTWPAGVHTYLGYANTTFTYPAIDSSSFTWTKSATADNGPEVTNSFCYGEAFPGEVLPWTPPTFRLANASPNPFNPTTTISFSLAVADQVTLKVYDMNGRLVSTLVNGMREAGQHQVTFDGSNLSSGVYIYTLVSGNNHAVGKMALMK